MTNGCFDILHAGHVTYLEPVSYTHLDVYKRQIFNQGASFKSLTDCASRQVTFFVMLSCHLCKTARNLPMKSHIPRFEQARILIAGDVMLDRYWHGPSSRISPEAPVPIVKVEEVEERPGGAANVAVNIATLGGQVRVLGIAGADEAATVLEAKLHRLGIASELIRLPGQATITKLRVLSRNQQLLRLDFEDGFPDFEPAALHERLSLIHI